ncbi:MULTISPECIES: hypothetical protein [Arsenophonus]|jgi:PBP1b-binding outer membrane lipoprotein LpoB|uniref:hypothetical protein n=2 Tax=Morganellaceae TaxID=1903414 RepID=UPI0015D8233C|nr:MULTISPECIES: hypothetical protein [Arsenophonus]UBX28571.1 hypothetical protein LDL57_12305 [Arsenophonus apicola]
MTMKNYFFALILFFLLAGCVSSDDYQQQYYKKKREEYQMGVGVVRTDSQRRAIMSGEKPDWSELPESRVSKEN